MTLSALQIMAGIALLIVVVHVLVIIFGARLHDVRSNAPAEPDELDELSWEWPERSGRGR